MSKSDFDPSELDLSRITFASQDGKVRLVDLFRDIELHRRASSRQ